MERPLDALPQTDLTGTQLCAVIAAYLIGVVLQVLVISRLLARPVRGPAPVAAAAESGTTCNEEEGSLAEARNSCFSCSSWSTETSTSSVSISAIVGKCLLLNDYPDDEADELLEQLTARSLAGSSKPGAGSALEPRHGVDADGARRRSTPAAPRRPSLTSLTPTGGSPRGSFLRAKLAGLGITAGGESPDWCSAAISAHVARTKSLPASLSERQNVSGPAPCDLPGFVSQPAASGAALACVLPRQPPPWTRRGAPECIGPLIEGSPQGSALLRSRYVAYAERSCMVDSSVAGPDCD